MFRDEEKDLFTIKTKGGKVVVLSRFVIKIFIIATLVPYILLGWQEVMIGVNKHLNNAIVSIYIVVIAMTVQTIINFVFDHFHFHSARNRTVGALVNSLLKYMVAIIAIVAVLFQFLGSSYMTELFAGLGIAAVVVGLGCQNLIGDTIAGIFMVFENNFKVGDIVVVNDWRGEVKEIGLRTTTIEDVVGNVKTINNSAITEVANNSKNISVVLCYVSIEYEESLLRVEEVLAQNLESIGNEIKEAVEVPTYLGVSELGESGIVLLITAKCHEVDIYTTSRQLNRQIKLLFDKNNITIPYKQVTISNKKD